MYLLKKNNNNNLHRYCNCSRIDQREYGNIYYCNYSSINYQDYGNIYYFDYSSIDKRDYGNIFTTVITVRHICIAIYLFFFDH